MSASATIRQRFESALTGDVIEQPIYAVYDWFIQNRPIDWSMLFEQGLGIIGHADLLQISRPNLQVIETFTNTEQGRRRDVRWVTDIGELHEWYLGEWRQEYLIKQPADYRIVARALEDRRVQLAPEAYHDVSAFVGERGITMANCVASPTRLRPWISTVLIHLRRLKKGT